MKVGTGILAALTLLQCIDGTSAWDGSNSGKKNKGGKKKGGKKNNKSKSKNNKKACPADAQEAAAMGAKVWGDLWLDVVQGPDCDGARIREVWSKYLTEDAVVKVDPILFGAPVAENPDGFPAFPNEADIPACTGREECADFLPGGTTFNCDYKNSLTFSTHAAQVDPHDCNKFTVQMNEYVTYPEGGCEFAVPTGRVYGFTLNHEKKGPYAKLHYIRFNCPWDLLNTLVQCPAGLTYDPEYKIHDDLLPEAAPDMCFPMEAAP